MSMRLVKSMPKGVSGWVKKNPNYPLGMTNIAIENGHRNSGFTPPKKIVIFHSFLYVYHGNLTNGY